MDYKNLLSTKAPRAKKSDAASYVDKDGNASNSLMHHEMTEGVKYPNKDCIKAAVKAGMDPETAKRIWG